MAFPVQRTFFLTLAVILTGSTAEAEVRFNEQIRPILSDRCYFCHGPDQANRKADLRLDLRDEATAERDDGTFAIKPGKPDESLLIERVTHADPDERMPPRKSKLKLTSEEIALLKQWISEGAIYEEHWSFIPLEEKPDLPEGSNPVDHFVGERLKKEGLDFSHEATRQKLIRRVTFDLTGLPPTLEEIDAFLADDKLGGFERVVDRLLASDAYGERMANHWMDVARYSDTYGYQVDRDRFVWPWRDWVIRAFNDNLSYDQFIAWQIAGDLLPNATRDQIQATTFNRLHPQKVEGGSVPEEFRVEYVADRTHTAGTAFLGLTMECSRCHDHKYDPITQKDYYSLFAYFNTIDEAGLYSYFTNSVPTPTMMLGTDAQRKQLADLAEAASATELKLQEVAKSRQGAFAKWRDRKPELEWDRGLIAHFDFEKLEGGKFANLAKPGAKSGFSSRNKHVDGRVGKAIQLTGDDAFGVGVGNFPRERPFSVSLWMHTPDEKDRAVIFHRSRAWTDAASRGYQLLIEKGKLSWSLIHFWPGNAIRVRTREVLPINQWKNVVTTYDGSSRADGLRIYVDGKLAEVEVIQDSLTKNITGGGGNNIAIGERFRDRGFKNGMVDEFRVFDRELTAVECAREAGIKSDDLKDYYLGLIDEEFAKARTELQAARKAHNDLSNGIPVIMVMRESARPRKAYVLNRGAYDARGEQVEASPPSFLPQLPDSAPKNRLGLAQWLVGPENPLTSRVAVNQLWQLIFGAGLVRTPEDFGSQGALPTHPELLDWLAREFMDTGWDTKQLLRTLVMSRTYRQTSVASKALFDRDPENLLLARGPRYRLPAEMLRDNALAVSGLLVNRLGGASVKPYEVAVSFKPVGHDKGEGLYRRSLYTYWKRTGPAPVMMALDASKRDVCSVKRERTATPLQALVMLNDPQFVEAARVFAARMCAVHEDDLDALLRMTFRTLTSRLPDDSEMKVLRRLYSEQLERFEAVPEEAKKLLGAGAAPEDQKLPKPKLAAVTALVNTLFNFDECVMKK